MEVENGRSIWYLSMCDGSVLIDNLLFMEILYEITYAKKFNINIATGRIANIAFAYS